MPPTPHCIFNPICLQRASISATPRPSVLKRSPAPSLLPWPFPFLIPTHFRASESRQACEAPSDATSRTLILLYLSDWTLSPTRAGLMSNSSLFKSPPATTSNASLPTPQPCRPQQDLEQLLAYMWFSIKFHWHEWMNTWELDFAKPKQAFRAKQWPS